MEKKIKCWYPDCHSGNCGDEGRECQPQKQSAVKPLLKGIAVGLLIMAGVILLVSAAVAQWPDQAGNITACVILSFVLIGLWLWNQ